ncbi:hypothetical protein RB195_000747 [Necator americanus]|uniref:Mos1 transposase HTH domain-containing protein n=1 Tax=Necator americanus TaxID=51031 RepID=A0ABR1DB69_NECAM
MSLYEGGSSHHITDGSSDPNETFKSCDLVINQSAFHTSRLRSKVSKMSNRNVRQIYFYEFKLGRTAAQTARNINEVWGQGSSNECTAQRWFQKFRAGNTSLEDESHGSRPLILDNFSELF